MMPAAKHFDPVTGVDIHIIQPPGPVPLLFRSRTRISGC